MAGTPMNTSILLAIEECLLGTIGTVRTMDAGDVLRDMYPGIDDLTLAERVRTNARFEARFVGHRRTGHVAPVNAETRTVQVEIVIDAGITTEAEVQADKRLEARQTMLELLEAACRALTWPGNLAATSAAVATGAVSGCLLRCGPSKVTREDWKARIFTAEMPGTALLKVLASTS